MLRRIIHISYFTLFMLSTLMVSAQRKVNFRSEFGKLKTKRLLHNVKHTDAYVALYSKADYVEDYGATEYMRIYWSTSDSSFKRVLINGLSVDSIAVTKEKQRSDKIEMSNMISAMQGRSIAISSLGNDSAGYSPFDESFYIPKSLYLRLNTIDTSSVTFQFDPNKPFTLFWDIDSLNNTGIILVLEEKYYVDCIPSGDKVVVLAKDDGRFSFQKEDFEKLPSNTKLLITAIRSNSRHFRLNSKVIALSYEETVCIDGLPLRPAKTK